MKKRLLLLLTGLLACMYGFAQTCNPSPDTFSRQSQVDSFRIQYPGCIHITGPAIFTGSDIRHLDSLKDVVSTGWLRLWQLDSLNSLQGLSSLDSVWFRFDIQDVPLLPDLQGLEGLRVVQGDLMIEDNVGLQSLNGLGNLSRVHRNLKLDDNPQLKHIIDLGFLGEVGNNLVLEDLDQLISLNGLGNLTQVGGNLEVIRNARLIDLSGLQVLQQIAGELEVRYNDSLQRLTGLGNVESVGSFLSIEDNPQLLNLLDLVKLDSIGRHLFLYRNSRLKSLAGLEALRVVGANLEIGFHDSLSDISSLALLKADSIDRLDLLTNPMLSSCGIQSICDFLDLGRMTVINANAPGCATLAEIQASCQATALEGEALLRSWRLFPNPASEWIRVRGDGQQSVSLQVFDGLGRMILAHPRQVEHRVNLVNFPRGHYVFRLYHHGESMSKLIWVQ